MREQIHDIMNKEINKVLWYIINTIKYGMKTGIK